MTGLPAACGALGRLWGPGGAVAGAAVGTSAMVGLGLLVGKISDSRPSVGQLASLGATSAISATAGAILGWEGAVGACAAGFLHGALK